MFVIDGALKSPLQYGNGYNTVTVNKFNPLPVQFKSLLHGQEGCVFFQWAFKCTYVPVHFSAFRPAKG
jgi:hypothetical protein